jgi:predicted CopG family antitoxin
MITIYITDMLYEKEYEIRVNEQISFYDLTRKLRATNKKKIKSSQLMVYERITKRSCDIDVSLSSLNVKSGMHFYIL